jgi:hypothetical protein
MKALLAAGDHCSALRMAAGWPKLGAHREAIQRGWAAIRDEATYRAMGYDPAAMVADGVAALKERYGLP